MKVSTLFDINTKGVITHPLKFFILYTMHDLKTFLDMAREHMPGRTDEFLTQRFYLMAIFEQQYKEQCLEDEPIAEYMCRRLDGYDSLDELVKA